MKQPSEDKAMKSETIVACIPPEFRRDRLRELRARDKRLAKLRAEKTAKQKLAMGLLK